MVDLFAGCGGLTDGFLQTGQFTEVAAVEWLKPQVETLRKRLKEKWKIKHADSSVLYFDIQRENELFNGWKNDEVYNTSKGLDFFVQNAKGIDIIIGGPPCQAYSIAGRVRDEHGMKNDYRNFLFEHYLSVVKRYRPKLFVFENVPGILSASPSGQLITEIISNEFMKIGYEIVDDLSKYAKINTADFGVPQNRQRVIIVGIRKDEHLDVQNHLKNFYIQILPKYKVDKKKTVREAIGDLPYIAPIWDQNPHKEKKSHIVPISNVSWHVPRYSNLRDMETFKTLAEDIEKGKRAYNSKKISELYALKIGSTSPIHRYHVLEADLPSTTIIAHLYKDGNRFIHYDSSQARTITPREAARIQSFDDDFDFVGTQGNVYQMIGNAVPPQFAKCLGMAIRDLYNIVCTEGN